MDKRLWLGILLLAKNILPKEDRWEELDNLAIKRLEKEVKEEKLCQSSKTSS